MLGLARFAATGVMTPQAYEGAMLAGEVLAAWMPEPEEVVLDEDDDG